MKQAPLPQNEANRLQAIETYNLLDTLPEPVFDAITRLASEICRTPISLVSLVDKDRQWFKAKQGLKVDQTPREYSFCAHAILNPEDIFVVPDARQDERFHDNPLTTGDPHVVFYAGVPLVTPDGHALGSLCVIDKRPRTLTENQLMSLKALGRWVSTEFELRKTRKALEATQNNLKTVRQERNKVKQILEGDLLPLAQTLIQASEALLENTPRADQVEGLNTIRQTGFSLRNLSS